MEDSNPLTSLTINLKLLKDCTIERPRPPSNKIFSLITTKAHPTLPLAIHNYTNKAAFLGQGWDNLGLAARTLITETTTGKVVSRSLPKFFNYHENFAYKPTGDEHAFAIEEKVDGSLISLFWYRTQWMMVSRSSFDSPHALAARRILDKKYPGSLYKLDKEKTYVFELVDPTMPIKVAYNTEDLIILSIVAKDGKEPPYGFDWTTTPFSRPRAHSATTVIPKELSTLNIENEEGFVVKFWSTPNDRYPRRIKVKFESYLEATKRSVNSMSKFSISSSTAPPSSAQILEVYTKCRRKIQHFKAAAISSTMEKHKRDYLQSLERIADDYGGVSWLDLIEKTWDRIGAIFSLQEAELIETMTSLQREGYKPNLLNAKSKVAINGFERRMRRKDIDPGLREALLSWFVCETVVRQVAFFIQHMEIPADLRSTDVLKCNLQVA